MNRASVETTITFDPEIAGGFRWVDDRTISFTPANPWPTEKTYQLTVSIAAQAENGLALEFPYQAEVHTVGALRIGEVTPAPDAEDVDIASPILVSFNRPVEPLVSTENMADLPDPLIIEPPVQGVGEWLNTSIYRFTPTEPLGGSTTYTITVGAGLTAVDGAELAEDYIWTFTTLTPHVVSIWPGVAQEERSSLYDQYPLNTPVKVTFSQPMDHASAEAAFALTHIESEKIVTGTFEWNEDSTELTFQPDKLLELNTAVSPNIEPSFYTYVFANYRVTVAPTARTLYGDAPLVEGRTEVFATVPLPGICGITYGERWLGYTFEDKPVPPGYYPVVNFCSPMNLRTLEDRIMIEPAPEDWELVAFSDTSYSAPLRFNTKQRTTYTVTVKAGAEDVYGNAIADDYTFSFTTGELPTYAYPMLTSGHYYPSQFITSTYRENTAFPIAISGTPSINFELYELPLLPRAVPDESDGKLIRAWTEELDSGDYGNVVASVNLASAEGGKLPPGSYRLKVDYPTRYKDRPRDEDEILFDVVTANVTIQRSVNEVLVWVTDLESGQPVSDAPVTVYNKGNVVAEGRTGADGVLRLPIDLAPDTYYDRDILSGLTIIAQDEGLLGLWSIWSEPVIPGERAMIYTDRPIYRPGETVNFRGVIRDRWDMQYSVPHGVDEVPITIQTSRYYGSGTALFEGSVPVSEFGTFSGQFTLPEDVELGEAYITMSFGQVEFQYVPFLDDQPDSWEKWLFEDEYNRTYETYVGFTIAEYRVPEFKVDVTAQQDSIIQGEPLNAVVNAEYYSGGALSGAALEWKTAGCATTFQYDGPGNYTFTAPIEHSDTWYYRGYGDDCTHFDDVDLRNTAGERKEDAYLYADNAEAQIGVDGRYLVTSDKTIAASGYPTLIAISATVTDESGQAISGQTLVMAHPANVYTGIKTDRYFYRAEEPVTVDLLAVTPQSDLIPGQRIDVEIMQVEWRRARTTSGTPYWDEFETPIESGQVVTDANGRAQYVFTPSKGGVFKVRTHAADAEGRTNGSAVRFYVVDNSRAALWKPAGESLEIITDRDTYLPGDTAHILIPLPGDGPGTVLLTAERSTILTYDVIQVDGGALVYDLPITDDMVPTVHLSAIVIYPPGSNQAYPSYAFGTSAFKVQAVDQILHITLTPSTAAAQPREKVAFDIQVTDAAGQPVVAEVGVKLTDKAILDLMPDNSLSLEEAFYGPQWTYVYTSIALTGLLDRFVPEVDEPCTGCGCGGCGGGGSPGFDAAQPIVRENFEQTPLWEPHVVTDTKGQAVVSLELPDNLTTWELDARAVTMDTKVGQNTTEIVSTLPLIVRPVAPRFFVVGDRIQLAAVINNNTDSAQRVNATLQAEGVTLEDPATQTVTVEPRGRIRVNWWAVAEDVAGVDLTFSAISESGLGDAAKPMLRTGEDDTIPVYHYTAPDTTGTAGILREGGSRTEGIALPPRLVDLDQSEMVVQITPSLAGSLTDSLTYLRNYPHQCVEQTISSFLPNVITYRALQSLGVDDPALRRSLETTIEQAYIKLKKEQNPDGGWGWFYQMESNPQVTAYALLGLVESAEFHQDRAMIDGVIRSLNNELEPATRYQQLSPWELNRQAFYVYVLFKAGSDAVTMEHLNTLYQYRNQLSLQSRAYLLLAYLDHAPDNPAVGVLSDEFRRTAILSATGAHWEEDEIDGWNWTSDIRSTSLSLSALVRATPDSDLLPNVVRWLMVARQGDHWPTTQETVWSIIALTDWMVTTGELQGNFEYNVSLNREKLSEITVMPDTTRDETLLHIAVRDLLPDDLNRLVIARSEGDGTLYYTAHLDLQLFAEDVEAIDRGVSVTRSYFLADDPEMQITSATVGDEITVQVIFTLREDMYYFVLESPIPAGTEMVDTRLLTSNAFSPGQQFQQETGYGWSWYGWWWIDRTELRDEDAYLYADYLPAGTYTYSYQVRASTPGEFQTMPTHAYAFYFPEVFGRTDGILFTVQAGK